MAELKLALLESVNRIQYFDNEGECLSFLHPALKARFQELSRKSSKISN